MAKAVFCIVNASQAASVVDRLKAAAFSNSDISVLMPDRSRHERFCRRQLDEGSGRRRHWRWNRRRFRWRSRLARRNRRLGDPRLGTTDCRRSDYGRTHWCRGRWHGRRPHGRVGRHGHSRIRGQALRGQSERRQCTHFSALRKLRRDGSCEDDLRSRGWRRYLDVQRSRGWQSTLIACRSKRTNRTNGRKSSGRSLHA